MLCNHTHTRTHIHTTVVLIFFLLLRKAVSYSYNPHLNKLCNYVAFLTEKSQAGDTVIYVGSNVGHHMLLLAEMFPALQFILYDHVIGKGLENAKESGDMEPNLKHESQVRV
jgi:hypothetical protein